MRDNQISRLFDLAPRLKLAYPLRDALTAIFDSAPDPATAHLQVHDWQAKGRVSGLHCFDTFLSIEQGRRSLTFLVHERQDRALCLLRPGQR